MKIFACGKSGRYSAMNRSCLGVLKPTQKKSGRSSATCACKSARSEALSARKGGQYVPTMFTPGKRVSRVRLSWTATPGLRP